MILEEKKLLLYSLQQTQRGRTGCHEQASLQAYVFSYVRLFATPCSLSGSSVHGIFQARVLEWVAISFSRGSSWPRDRIWVSCTAGRCFTIWATREAPLSPPSELRFVLQYPASPVLHLWRYSWIPSPMADRDSFFSIYIYLCMQL